MADDFVDIILLHHAVGARADDNAVLRRLLFDLDDRVAALAVRIYLQQRRIDARVFQGLLQHVPVVADDSRMQDLCTSFAKCDRLVQPFSAAGHDQVMGRDRLSRGDDMIQLVIIINVQ